MAEVRDRWPGVAEAVAAGLSLGQSRYSGLSLIAGSYEDLAFQILGRCWAWRLRTDPGIDLPAAAAEFAPGFLADLALLATAQEDPFPAAKAFFAACPEVAARMAALEARARSRVPAPGLDPRAFQVKFFGASLYHLLRPLRLLPPQGRSLRLAELRQVAAELAEKVETQDMAPSLLLATALAYGIPESVEAFRREFGPEIGGNFRKMKVRVPSGDRLVDDVVGTACLRGCSFFAYGTLHGWLWYIQKTYIREMIRGEGPAGMELTGREPAANAEPEDREFRQGLAGAIAGAIGSLPEEDRELMAGLLAGRTLVAVAREQGVAPSTMMRRRDRLYRRLREAILDSLLPREAGREERQEKVAEILRHLPNLDLDLSSIGAPPPAEAHPRHREPEGGGNPTEEEGTAPGTECLVPRL